MDQKLIKEAQKHLLDINKTIKSLDPAIRAAAFNILVPYYFDVPPDNKEEGGKEKGKGKKEDSPGSLKEFFGAHENSKPPDNVFLIAAWLYSQHGAIPITSNLCREISKKVGITIPNRPDATMRAAQRKLKNMFRQQGKAWVLTTHGELFIKNKYGVSKGNKPLPEADDK